MGIRIKRNIGYALSGLRYSKKKDSYTDKRINQLGWLESKWEDKERTWTRDGFFRFCKHRMDKFSFNMLRYQFDKTRNKKPMCFDFHNWIHYSCNDFGMPGVLMLQPLEWPEWSRGDDIIDYCEFNMRYRSSENELTWLDFPIYPYSDYMDSETGEKLSVLSGEDRLADYVREMWYNWRSTQYKDQSAKQKKAHSTVAQLCAKKLGMTIAQAKKRYTPAIPESIEMMARYLCLFEDESTI